MKNVTDYIDEAIKRTGAKSNRKLCEMLGMSPVWVINIKQGRLPTDETMLKLAELACIPPHIALLDLNIWRSKGKSQAVYKKLAQAISTASINCMTWLLPALIFVKSNAEIIYITESQGKPN